MAIRKIITVKHSSHKLNDIAELVSIEMFNTPYLREISKDLHDTLIASKATGIAAPQIGIQKQIIAFGGKPSLNFPDFKIPFTVLINPNYKPLGDDKVLVWEHCLSLPGKRGRTVRYAQITYTGFNACGKAITAQATGLLAVLLQHEIDHLAGKLFPCCVLDPNEYGDIKTFEASRGACHHIEDGLKPFKG